MSRASRHKGIEVLVSGLYSGPNPSPGVGTSRSLRAAFPAARLVGVDYSPKSTGLHWADLNDLWLQRPWDELSLEEYGHQIRRLLDGGAMWISGLDLETIWLATAVGRHPNLLVPPVDALDRTAKPAAAVGESVGLRAPASIGLAASDREILSFARTFDWQVWLKGPNYEARKVHDWPSLSRAREELSAVWGSSEAILLQQHIAGHEGSIALVAHHGRLIGCVEMMKRDVTSEGKTWSGHVRDVEPDLRQRLAFVVEDLRWTGGGEIEFVQEASGLRWLIEWNPRFPAWIHGATLAGHNLPAALIEAASGIPARSGSMTVAEFARVVIEIPVRRGYPLSAPQVEPVPAGSPSKHPSGMPTLARRLRRSTPHARSVLPLAVPPELSADLAALSPSDSTPRAAFLEKTALALFSATAQSIRHASNDRVTVRIAYSIKTNPDRRLLRLAREHGFLVEAISALEVRHAIGAGFSPEEVILNGPGKYWPSGMAHPSAGTVFVDSLEELNAAAWGGDVRLLGVRLRPAGVASRFGVDVADHVAFMRSAKAIARLPRGVAIGVHFHVASSAIGASKWRRVLQGMLQASAALESASGRPIECLDIGGGWTPEDLNRVLDPSLPAIVAEVSLRLPRLRSLTVELGKGLAEPTMALVSRVIEVRGTDDDTEAVVDASVAELPEASAFPHPVLVGGCEQEPWRILPSGAGRILGRLCMEDDILAANVELPRDLRSGDAVVFGEAGAYDRSMSYDFARG